MEYNKQLINISDLIARNLKRLRGGMFKSDLAKRAKVSRGTIERLEKGGEDKPPRLKTLIKIADALGVGLDELFKKPEAEINIKSTLDDTLDKLILDNGYFIQFLDRYFEKKFKELKSK